MFWRTVSTIMLMLLLASMLTLAFNIQPVSADGTIYIRADGSVDPPTAPILRDGNIYTFVGNINGSIVVEKGNVVVDGKGYVLQGYGYGDGFLLRGRSLVTIQNVNIKGFFYGINMNLSSYNTVSANLITDNKYGLYLYDSQNNTLSGNTLERNYQNGIYLFYHSSFNVFRNNRMANNTYNFYEQALPHFRNNVDTSNTVDGKPIYYWINKRDMTIPSDAGYVALINCTRINVANLNLRGNGDGVLLVDSMNIVVSGNTITDSVFGIRDWSLEIASKNNNIRDNEITRCSSGIDMQYSSNNTLRNNHMMNNSGSLFLYGEDRSYFAHDIDTSNTIDGRPVYYWVNRKDCELPLNAGYVGLVGSTNITVRDLDLKNSGQLLLAYTNDSLIENNRIIDGFDGISMISSHGNTILGNSIVSNDYTIYAYSSTGNLVYHNDFVNNTRPPDFRRSSPAVWDNGYPSGGNYWSDYNGTDFYSGPNQNVAGSDGIGDTPYIIGVNNTDRYPLMNPWNMRADSFRFPLDGLWTVSQRFGGYNYNWNDYHLGEDVLRSFEAPVFAPADGVVKHNAKRTGYGYVVIIEHQLKDGTSVCSVLGHLKEAGRLPVGATITKGQLVGYLSSVPEENGGIIHLHFGIRKGMYSEELDFDGKWRYRGYGPIDIVGSWCPPSAFIEYYNENKEMPPNYSLTIDTEESGAFAATRSSSVCLLTFKTQLSLIATHPWFQRWIDTDNDNLNPTTVTMFSNRVVIERCLSAPPPPQPEPWDLAIDLIGADYSYTGGKGWPWIEGNGWGGGHWLSKDEINSGYWHYDAGGYTKGSGIDCSGLIFWAYNKAWGAKPERMVTPITQESTRENTNFIGEEGAQGQYWNNCWIDSTFIPIDVSNDLQPGDCLFFDTPEWGNPDHVAMYVGGPFQYTYGSGNTFTYNVVEATAWGDKIVAPAFYNSTTGNLTTLQPSTGNLRDPPLHVDYYGRPVHQIDYRIARNMFSFTTGSPIDLIVTDPDGIIITKEIGETPGMSYVQLDLDGDGELDDEVKVWEPKAGNYLVTVIPEPGALPPANFSLKVSGCNTTILLADYSRISEVPTEPYIIACNETSIMLRTINIAATNVSLIKGIIGQGYSPSINVTVQNQGTLEETFNFTVYANATPIALRAATLTSGNSTTITFPWNTTGFAYGNYTISAYAEPVLNETYIVDNNVSCIVPVHVGVPSDISGPTQGVYDGTTNMRDIQYLILLFNTNPSSPNWKPNADINDDGTVNMRDIQIPILNFNKHE